MNLSKKILVAVCPCCKRSFALRGNSKREPNPEHPDNIPVLPQDGPVPTLPPGIEDGLFSEEVDKEVDL